MATDDPLSYLWALDRLGIRLDLGPVTSLLHRLDDPHERFPSLLIAGTNGKGSIGAMLASILQSQGMKVGHYSSPHLVDVRERIRIDGAMISLADFRTGVAAIRERVVEAVTFFECVTAVAMRHFSLSGVEIAVLEVGMGGRLDATNVVVPLAGAISNISREHESYLGRSLAAIAAEKGGIIKEGGICVTAARQRPVLSVLERICRERGARLVRVGQDIRVRRGKAGTFAYHGIRRTFRELPLPLLGRHQVYNAAVAIGMIEVLAERGVAVSDRAIRSGLRRVRWPGRMEILREKPTVLVDGAHNPAGIAALCRGIRDHFPAGRRIWVFGVLGDKNFPAMIRAVARDADRVFFTRPESDRAVEPAELRRIAGEWNIPAEDVEDPADAVARALSVAGPDDLVCVAGSLYLIGSIRRLFSVSGRVGGGCGTGMGRDSARDIRC